MKRLSVWFRPLKQFIIQCHLRLLRIVRPLDPSGVSFHTSSGRKLIDIRHFAANPRTAVILGFGQSSLSNECDPNGLFVPDVGVFNFNIFDGQCYEARDPLLGATGYGSNLMTRLGDLLVRSGIFDQVILLPIAHGGTYVADWMPGGWARPRLVAAITQLQRKGLGVTHALWANGEAEASHPDCDGAAWARHFNLMVASAKQMGMAAPIYVAQCTVCCSAPNEIIRTAQRKVVAANLGIFAGPDLDVIGTDERWDRCHFSTGGLERAAQLWLKSICSNSLQSTSLSADALTR